MTTLLNRPSLATTVVATPGPPAEPEPRRSTGTFRQSDVLALLGAAAAAVGLTAVIYTRLAPFTGLLGFLVMAFAVFVGLYTLLVSLEERAPAVRDRVALVVIHSLAFLLLLALLFIVIFTVARGREALPNIRFFTTDLSDAGPLEPIEVGGVLHAVIGTLQQITLALLITVPLGLTCAVFLNEIPGAFSRFVRTIAEAMTALPSIVAGLFIYAAFVLQFGNSGFAASLAISVMMLPIIIRAADVVIRLVPGSLKEASLALGAGQWRTVWHVVLPTSRSGLTTAVILGTARGIGETSPVLLTAGFTTNFNGNPFSGPQVSLPLAVFNLVQSPAPAYIARGFGAAALLLMLVVVLFVIARIIGGRGPGELTKRQQRRRTAASQRDLARADQRAANRSGIPLPAPISNRSP